jgi:hypothetical protein
MVAIFSPEKDLKEPEAMACGLSEYVRGDALYGSAGGGLFGAGAMPSLTIGALLMRLRRLEALAGQLSAAQRERLSQARRTQQAVQSDWRTHYEEKASREALSRLDAIRMYFQECTSQPTLCAGAYGPEALRRTIVEELMAPLATQPADTKTVTDRARAVDAHLRGLLVVEGFVWDPALQPVYPREQFWWLYMRPAYPDEVDG